MAEVTIKLYSGDWYWISGHGAVASIEKRKWPFDPRELCGQEIMIDNKRFRVRGVERWAMHWHTDADWPIGIGVEPLDDAVSSRRWRRTNGPKLYEDLMQEQLDG